MEPPYIPGATDDREMAGQAAERIYLACQPGEGSKQMKAIPDASNPASACRFVTFTTSKPIRWTTYAARCQVNLVACDSEWEAEFCRVAEAHPRVPVYVKNQGLGLEVPCRDGATPRRYLPDFILHANDGRWTRRERSWGSISAGRRNGST